MPIALIYADFNNLDDQNRLRLTSRGTLKDLERHGIRLQDGLRLTFYSDDADDGGQPDDLLVDGIVEFDVKAKCWVAAVDWKAVRHDSADSVNGRSNP